mmetsp:Transcript_18817/g.30904  ORF Transcript_18817/g.30904 Transcript_18817/m.30904 type:complete len:468 (-) Transcript_18817:472-1875(-)
MHQKRTVVQCRATGFATPQLCLISSRNLHVLNCHIDQRPVCVLSSRPSRPLRHSVKKIGFCRQQQLCVFASSSPSPFKPPEVAVANAEAQNVVQGQSLGANDVSLLEEFGGSNGVGLRGGSGGGGNHWHSDGPEGDSAPSGSHLDVWVRANSKSWNLLPPDLRQGALRGIIDTDTLTKFIRISSFPFLSALMKIGGFRDRFLADTNFVFKLLTQEIVGNGTATVAEIAVRKEHFWEEAEYFISDIMVGLVLEAMFVWLLAPSINLHPEIAPGMHSPWPGVSRFLSRIPANAFQRGSFSLQDRLSSVVLRGLEYAALGLMAGVVGTAFTYVMVAGKKHFSSEYLELRKHPPIWKNAIGWALFLGLSSNPRFQLVEGLERLVGDTLGKRNLTASLVAMVVVRFSNNLIGGMQFIHMFRAMGLQETNEDALKRKEEQKGFEQEGPGVPRLGVASIQPMDVVGGKEGRPNR